MPDPTVWPGHAYVPGQTPRHPDGTFDAVRNTAVPGLDPSALARTAAFRLGLRYLDAGFFWEAHELLEPVWMALPDGSAERRFVQGLIQIANGFLKLKMSRPKAAMRLAHIARDLVPEPNSAPLMTVDMSGVHQRIDGLIAAAEDAK